MKSAFERVAFLEFCNNLEVWDRVGSVMEVLMEVREGGSICIPRVMHVDVWQKPTQCCKAIILQLQRDTF